MKWVKLHTGLLDNDAFDMLSKDARDTFLYCLAIAGKQDQRGALAIRAVGPMSPEQIARYTRIPVPRQKKALDELVGVGAFLCRRNEDNAFTIARWEEKAGTDSEATSNADRQRRYRQRKALQGDAQTVTDAIVTRNVTCNVTNNDGVTTTVTDKEEEVDIDTTLAGGESAHTRESVTPTVTRNAERWVQWFYDAAVSTDVLKPVLDPTLWARPQIDGAVTLLATYGEAECSARALAMFRAIRDGCRHLAPKVEYLSRGWDYHEVRAALGAMKPPSQLGDDLDARLRAAETASDERRLRAAGAPS